MDQSEAIARIKSAEAAIRALGARALYLFGSTVRGEAGPASDIDIFVDRTDDRSLGLTEFFDLEAVLEAALETKVDLTTREALHPVLRKTIEQTTIRVL